jgi:hypothetical protein
MNVASGKKWCWIERFGMTLSRKPKPTKVSNANRIIIIIM